MSCASEFRPRTIWADDAGVSRDPDARARPWRCQLGERSGQTRLVRLLHTFSGRIVSLEAPARLGGGTEAVPWVMWP